MRRKARRRSIPLNTEVHNASLGYGTNVPPLATHVRIYFSQKGRIDADADSFFESYEALDWKTGGGTPIRNWKVLASDWIFDKNQEKKLRQRQSVFF